MLPWSWVAGGRGPGRPRRGRRLDPKERPWRFQSCLLTHCLSSRGPWDRPGASLAEPQQFPLCLRGGRGERPVPDGSRLPRADTSSSSYYLLLDRRTAHCLGSAARAGNESGCADYDVTSSVESAELKQAYATLWLSLPFLGTPDGGRGMTASC